MLFGFECAFLTRNWKFEGSGGQGGEIGLLLYSPPREPALQSVQGKRANVDSSCRVLKWAVCLHLSFVLLLLGCLGP